VNTPIALKSLLSLQLINHMQMKPFNISLPSKGRGYVINKRVGIRRPVKFLFFRFKNKQRIIAYTIIVESGAEKNEFLVFKTREKGKWLKGARKNGESIQKESEFEVSRAIKKAIDEFENKQGDQAFQELF